MIKDIGMKRNMITIGIDQSYSYTGISVAMNGELKKIDGVDLSPYTDRTSKRDAVKKRLNEITQGCDILAKKIGNCDIFVVFERIRLQSIDNRGGNKYINIDYLTSMGALTACIVDTVKPYNIHCFSVDTRAWKAQIVGTTKKEFNDCYVPPEKWPTVKHVISLGFGEQIKDYLEPNTKKKKYLMEQGLKYTYNNDRADSACIALYPFISHDKLKLEWESR